MGDPGRQPLDFEAAAHPRLCDQQGWNGNLEVSAVIPGGGAQGQGTG